MKVDRFGIPVFEALSKLPRSKPDKNDSRLESILGRKLTITEASAVESMASEHASYGSTRWYLKTLLEVGGPNHVAGVGDEAAAAVLYVNPNGSGTVTICYSSESHNGPSFVCPPPGAATGAGGNQRDNAVENGRKPDLQCEARRQSHPKHNPHNDPVRRHTHETTLGIAEYCNAMGIPHGTGSMKYDVRFSGNNLVNVMSISVSERNRLLSNKVPTTDHPSKFVGIYVGKASDTTGIGGTKFASVAIDMTHNDLNEKAVQDPDPHLQEADCRGIEMVVDTAIREGWINKISFKDMGAAGLLCSTVEQLHGKIGVVINGDLVPQNHPRNSTELLEAETQERFFIYVHEDYAHKVLDIFNNVIGLSMINKGAAARIVGRCNDTGKYVFIRNNTVDVDIPADDLKAGPLLAKPVREIEYKPQKIPRTKRKLKSQIELVLDSINFKSDAPIHQHYDKHVRSNHIVVRGEGAAELFTHPLIGSNAGYSVYFDSNPLIGLIDPKRQAEDSFVRGAWRMAAVGCSVIGVTNNANYGKTDNPGELWQFVEGQKGITRACRNWPLEQQYVEMISKDAEISAKLEKDPRRYATVNSGNCSMNKANANTGTAIPPTTILGLIGWTNAPDKFATWDIKADESTIYLIGDRQPNLGATDYLQAVFGPDCLGDRLFEHDYSISVKEVAAVIQAIRHGLVSAANNIEDGGLCNAVAEMLANTKSNMEVKIELDRMMGSLNVDLSYEQKLFSEAYGMILQVSAKNEDEFRKLIDEHDVTAYRIGFARPARISGKLEFHTEHDTGLQRRIKLFQGTLKENYQNKITSKLAMSKN